MNRESKSGKVVLVGVLAAAVVGVAFLLTQLGNNKLPAGNQLTDSNTPSSTPSTSPDPVAPSSEFTDLDLAGDSNATSDVEPAPIWRANLGGNARLVGHGTPPEVPVKNLLDLYPMGASAENDYQIYRALKLCERAPKSASQLEEMQLKLLTTRSPDGRLVRDDTTSAERLLTAKYELCKDLTTDDLQSTLPRLQSAADLDLPEAQLDFANVLLDSVTSETPQVEIDAYLGYLASARKQGIADAYYWSGHFGVKGLLGITDKTEALANIIMAEAAYSEFGVNRNVSRFIDQEFRLLFPEQQEAVISRVKEMIAGNNCCIVIDGPTWEEQLRER